MEHLVWFDVAQVAAAATTRAGHGSSGDVKFGCRKTKGLARGLRVALSLQPLPPATRWGKVPKLPYFIQSPSAYKSAPFHGGGKVPKLPYFIQSPSAYKQAGSQPYLFLHLHPQALPLSHVFNLTSSLPQIQLMGRLLRAQASVCFGANSTAGDTFLVRHISLVPVKSGKTPGAVVKLNNGDDAPPRGCPEEFFVEEGAMSVLDMYESLPSRIEAELPPLHHYSYYGATSLEQWDEIVRSHVQGLEYQAGQEVFEAGCAAGAFLDSLTRQYGVSVHGSDLSPSLIRIARSRIYAGQSKYANR